MCACVFSTLSLLSYVPKQDRESKRRCWRSQVQQQWPELGGDHNLVLSDWFVELFLGFIYQNQVKLLYCDADGT